jgi:hypothetical protein
LLPLATRFTEASPFKGKGAANAEYKDANNTTREYKKRDMLMLNDTVIVRRSVCEAKVRRQETSSD